MVSSRTAVVGYLVVVVPGSPSMLLFVYFLVVFYSFFSTVLESPLLVMLGHPQKVVCLLSCRCVIIVCVNSNLICDVGPLL